MVARCILGEIEADVREDLDRRVEQHRARNPLGRGRAQLEHETPPEAVPQPGCRLLHARGIHGLEHVGEVGRNVPRRLVAGAAVAAQIRREHAEPAREPFLGKAPEPPPVGRDTVQADERRSVRVSPLVHVEPHQPPLL